MAREILLKDIAKKMGVSPATVSRIIRKQTDDLTETQKEIVRLVKQARSNHAYVREAEEHYNIGNIALVTIGLPSVEMNESECFGYTYNDFFSRCIHGVEKGIRELNGHLNWFNFQSNPNIFSEVRQAVQNVTANGIILLLLGEVNEAKYLTEISAICPTVQVDSRPGIIYTDSVIADRFGGYQISINKILELGHRRIGCWSDLPINVSHMYCENIYNMRLDEEGLQYRRFYYDRVDSRPFFIRMKSAFQEYLNDTDRPTAIMCSNDAIALTLLRIATDYRIKIPDELSIIGFDNVGAGIHCNPPLASINCNLFEMGYQAVQLLYHRLLYPQATIRRIAIPAMFVERKSLGKNLQTMNRTST